MGRVGSLLNPLLGLLWALGGAHGRVYYNRIQMFYPPAAYVQLETALWDHVDVLMERGFGFLAGGEVHFSMSCPGPEPAGRPDFWLLFCNRGDAREFARMTDNQISYNCQRLAKHDQDVMARTDAYCFRYRLPFNASSSQGQYVFQKQMLRSAFYTVLLLQCHHDDGDDVDNTTVVMAASRQCQSALLALNPGGVHLGSDEVLLPLIYTVINLVWATLVAAWFFNWVTYFKYSNRLHRLISSAPIFKAILVVLVLLWWQEIANTGQEPKDIASVGSIVQSIEDGLLFLTMMVIAEGWGVIRCHIKHYRWTSLLLLFMVFATSLMCVYWVHRYFLAFSVCCVVFMMYKALKWCSHNMDLLRRRRRKIRRFIARHSLHYKGYVTIDMQLCAKLRIYRYFRIICAAFSMTYAVAVTLATFLQEYSYIKALTFELPELLVYVAIGVLFRLRNFEAYANIELVPPKENIVVFELPSVCVGQVNPHVTLGLPLHFKVEKETQTPCRRRWRSSMR